MDKEQARFILRSFRPNGEDVNDDDFADALAVAMEDRELGEWLSRERAFDASFAAAVTAIQLPHSLRHDILSCLALQRADFPQAEDGIDTAMIGALAGIQPPVSLRDELLAAMDRTASVSGSRRIAWRWFALPTSAAAGIALALFLTHDDSQPATAAAGPVPVDVVQAGFIHTFESPLFSLDEHREDPNSLVRHLKSRKLPCPGCLPPGLAKVKSIGCRELVVDGKSGSIICFDEPRTGIVHLVVYRREDVCGELPERDHPSFSQEGHWAVARWEDKENVFILIGNTDVHKLASLF